MLLNIKNLHVSIGGKEILKGLNLGVNEGEIHAIMGPNGTGKSTLAAAITGREGYEITEGEIWYKGKNIVGPAGVFASRRTVHFRMVLPTIIIASGGHLEVT